MQPESGPAKAMEHSESCVGKISVIAEEMAAISTLAECPGVEEWKAPWETEGQRPRRRQLPESWLRAAARRNTDVLEAKKDGSWSRLEEQEKEQERLNKLGRALTAWKKVKAEKCLDEELDELLM